MSATITAEPQAAAAPEPDPPRRRTARRRLLWGGGLALAVAGGTGWWVTHPTSLDSYGWTGTSVRGEMASPERPAYATGLISGREEPDVAPIAADALIDVPRGSATAEVVICRLSGESGIGLMQEGPNPDGSMGLGPQGCAELRPLDGERLAGNEDLLVQVWPEEPGSIVVVDGIDLTYSIGLQRGTQFIDLDTVIEFPEADRTD